MIVFYHAFFVRLIEIKRVRSLQNVTRIVKKSLIWHNLLCFKQTILKKKELGPLWRKDFLIFFIKNLDSFFFSPEIWENN